MSAIWMTVVLPVGVDVDFDVCAGVTSCCYSDVEYVTEYVAAAILTWMLLYVCLLQKGVGVRRITLKHAIRQDPALRSWRASR